MKKGRSRARKLTDEQYDEYINLLKNNGALYNADGSYAVPEIWNENKQDGTENKKGE